MLLAGSLFLASLENSAAIAQRAKMCLP